jgi:hypothetical protein
MKTLFDSDLTLEEAEELIKNGADVNMKNKYHVTPLHRQENIDIINLLIIYFNILLIELISLFKKDIILSIVSKILLLFLLLKNI